LFSVSGTEITISSGDTGAVRFHVTATRADTGAAFTFGERDRAVFSIKDNYGTLKRQKAYPLVNNAFVVVFTNQDTENIGTGTYSWDVRFVINPYYDTDPPEGPWPEYSKLTFPIASGTQCMYLGACYRANQAINSSEAFTAAHWDAVWPDYDDLTFPVSSGQRCMHSGTYYMANQDIDESEDWTPGHWAFMDYRKPVDGDQVLTPSGQMSMSILTVVGDI